MIREKLHEKNRQFIETQCKGGCLLWCWCESPLDCGPELFGRDGFPGYAKDTINQHPISPSLFSLHLVNGGFPQIYGVVNPNGQFFEGMGPGERWDDVPMIDRLLIVRIGQQIPDDWRIEVRK